MSRNVRSRDFPWVVELLLLALRNIPQYKKAGREFSWGRRSSRCVFLFFCGLYATLCGAGAPHSQVINHPPLVIN